MGAFGVLGGVADELSWPRSTYVASLKLRYRTEDGMRAKVHTTWFADIRKTSEQEMKTVVADVAARTLLLDLAKKMRERRMLSFETTRTTETSKDKMEKVIQAWRAQCGSKIALHAPGAGVGQW